jgi:hypothetical protein
LPFVGAVVVAGAIVVASWVVAATAADVGAVGPWVGAAEVARCFAVLRLLLDADGEVGDAATTMDGLSGEGVCSVSY